LPWSRCAIQTFLGSIRPCPQWIASGIWTLHTYARGLPYDIAWEYGDVFKAAGLNLLEWRGHLWLNTTNTQVLEFAARLLPSQKTGLLAARLRTDQEIDELTAEVNRAAARPLRRSATYLIVDATG
jgi:hypothetical protein